MASGSIRPKASRHVPPPTPTPPLHLCLADLMVDANDPDVVDACCVILRHLSHRKDAANIGDQADGGGSK
tara:strand:- start:120 stop:329 length:210 start_codon:yes stop_codon:yes gene_type:complete